MAGWIDTLADHTDQTKKFCIAACVLLSAAVGLLVSAPAHAQSEKLLYAFGPGTGATRPLPGNLVRIGAYLYGTTVGGGQAGCGKSCGTVFRVGPHGTYDQLYAFKGGRDGEDPAGLIAVGDVLYGVTYVGGTGQLCQPDNTPIYSYTGCGTVFRLTQSGQEKVLYSFQGGADGSRPVGLVAVNGALIGVTATGGFAGPACSQQGCGTIFQIAADGKYTQLYQFLGGRYDGSQPQGSLVVAHRQLFGLTAGGGFSLKGCNSSCGTAFRFPLDGSGPERAIHFFGLGDGISPASLIGIDNMLYGVGGGHGNYDAGTVFQMTLTGSVTVLHTFSSVGGPVMIVHDATGMIYGAAVSEFYGPAMDAASSPCQSCGYVFTLGAHNTQFADIYDFQGGSDGDTPEALLATGGLIFGATAAGGGNSGCQNGCGTVFRLVP